MGHLRTLKESKWTFFYLKTCLLSIKAANWGTGSLQLLCSRFIIKHLLSFWTTWEPWLILLQESCSSIKLTQRNCLLLLDKSPHSDLQAMTIQTSQAWSWRIFLASNDGTLPGARRSSTRHHSRPWGQGESLPPPTQSPSHRLVWSAPLGPILWSCAGCQSVHPSDSAHEGINTSTVMELHMSISATTKKVFLTWFFPPFLKSASQKMQYWSHCLVETW